MSVVDATVALEGAFFMLSESDAVQEFCIVLSDEPPGGRAIPIVVFLSPAFPSDNGAKNGW